MKTNQRTCGDGRMSLLRIAWLLIFSVAATSCGGGVEHGNQTDPEVGTISQPLFECLSGFAWVSNGVVSPAYSDADEPSTISVTNPSTGNFTVVFPNCADNISGGNVQVVAYGSGSERCKVLSWLSFGSTFGANVFCHNVAGAPVNTNFVVQLSRGEGTAEGFVWANQPSTASYVPSTFYNYTGGGSNPGNGQNVIFRNGVGDYTVEFVGLAANGGSVQVTAYGGTTDHCKVSGWFASGANEMVNVLCFNNAGNRTDSLFSAVFRGDNQVALHDQGAYAWANDPSSATYTPSSTWSFDSAHYEPNCDAFRPGTNTANRVGTGRYIMRHTNIDSVDSTVHVTAYGSDSSYCKVSSWLDDGAGGVNVGTLCFNVAGAPVDSRYDETYHCGAARVFCQ